MNKGNKIADFSGTKFTFINYLLRDSVAIVASGYSIWANLDIYRQAQRIVPELVFGALCLSFFTIFMIYSTYKRTRALALTAYEHGIDVPKQGFFRWDELRVSQQQYTNEKNFLPCYYIRLGYDKQTVIFQYVEDYTGLYHLLYSKSVPGADRELLIYNTTIDGVKVELKPVYCAVFDPKKNELRQEKGNPFERQG